MQYIHVDTSITINGGIIDVTNSLYINGTNMGSLEATNTVTSNSSTGGSGNGMKQNKKNF